MISMLKMSTCTEFIINIMKTVLFIVSSRDGFHYLEKRCCILNFRRSLDFRH